jgi:uncharacterized membrane protein
MGVVVMVQHTSAAVPPRSAVAMVAAAPFATRERVGRIATNTRPAPSAEKSTALILATIRARSVTADSPNARATNWKITTNKITTKTDAAIARARARSSTATRIPRGLRVADNPRADTSAATGQTCVVFDGRRLVLILALGASTALTIGLGITDPAGAPGYPTLFLAWMPLVFALLFSAVHRYAALLLVGACWLAFLPNAPYLVTDLIHLSGHDELWRHVLQFGFAAWTGTLLGVVSLRIVHVEVERRFGSIAGWSLVAVSTGLCAIGVVIGRFQRWNSWDLVTSPGVVATSTIEWVRSPIANVRSTGVAAAVATFFGIAYVTTWALDGIQRRGEAR